MSDQTIVKRIVRIEDRLDRLNAVETDLLSGIHSQFLSLPALRGYWPMTTIDNDGDANDLSINSNQANNNSTSLYNTDTTTPGNMSYVEFDGSGDYLNVADNTDLSITGTESTINSAIQGLTVGGWFYMDTVPGGDVGMTGKYVTSGNQRSYLIFMKSDSAPSFIVSSDGTSGNASQVNAGTMSTGRWNFLVARFNPSTEVAIWLNGTGVSNTTSIEADIFDSTADFRIGRFDSGYFDGRAAFCFACAAMAQTATINKLWFDTRKLFGV